ncbi:hypothetical protein K7432_016815 [Basidiobolus ranarum]|uniref:NADH:flavin oxidoreductase/NADH oxidase N-terminal domain-containing protein n=1 Tax=Basidiobolus ranarum TaxID=34480 RepID=A0ABR2VM72_9FUNG
MVLKSTELTDILLTIENRGRFALEVVDAVVNAVGAERTAIRFSPDGAFQGMADENPVKTWSYLTAQLQKNHPSLAYLHFIEARANIMSDSAEVEDTLEPFREIWKGPFISSSGFSNATETAADIAERTNDLISYGRAFIANPDLPERLRNGWELNKYDRSTFYSNEAAGYTDYPFYNQIKNN